MGEERIIIGLILGGVFAWILFKIYMYANDLERKYQQTKKEKGEIEDKLFYKELRVKDLEEKLGVNKDGTVRRRYKRR